MKASRSVSRVSRPVAIRAPYLKAGGRPWLAQIWSWDGRIVETLTGEHRTESLALADARREIANRSKL